MTNKKPSDRVDREGFKSSFQCAKIGRLSSDFSTNASVSSDLLLPVLLHLRRVAIECH